MRTVAATAQKDTHLCQRFDQSEMSFCPSPRLDRSRIFICSFTFVSWHVRVLMWAQIWLWLLINKRCLFLLQSSRKRQWSKTGRFVLMGKARKFANRGRFIPVCSFKHWITVSSKHSTSLYRSAPNWRPRWDWHKHRYEEKYALLCILTWLIRLMTTHFASLLPTFLHLFQFLTLEQQLDVTNCIQTESSSPAG